MAIPKTHFALATTAKGVLQQIDLPNAPLSTGEVRVKMHYSALIPFDTYQLDGGYLVEMQGGYPMVLGFAGSGLVAEVGEGVSSLAIGDKVTVMTFPASKNKGLQEYSMVHYSAAAKIPDSLPLQEAASLSDNFVTAFWTLFGPNLKLEVPSSFPATVAPPDANIPILVYGAGSSAGQYIVQLLKLTGFTSIFAVASSHNHAHLKELGASHTFDYRKPKFVEEILAANGGEKIKTAIDIIAARPSLSALTQLVGPGSKIAILLPVKDGETVTIDVNSEMTLGISDAVRERFPGVELLPVGTFQFQTDEFNRENLMPKILPDLLSRGIVKPNKIRLLKDGTLKERVEVGLDLLRNNKISDEKVVVQIADT